MYRFLILILIGFPLLAQQETANESEARPADVTRVITLDHADPEDVAVVIRAFGPYVVANRDLGVVAVKGKAQEVAAALDAVAELDKPGKSGNPRFENSLTNIQLDLYLVGVTDGPGDDLSDSVVGPVVEELRKNFPYQGYRLLETSMIRGRHGKESQTMGLVPIEIDGSPEDLQYLIAARLGVLEDRASIGDLRANWRVPVRTADGKVTHHSLQMQTHVDVPFGKMVVVGKSGAHGSVRGIFLVLRAELAE